MNNCQLQKTCDYPTGLTDNQLVIIIILIYSVAAKKQGARGSWDTNYTFRIYTFSSSVGIRVVFIFSIADILCYVDKDIENKVS